MDYNIIELFLHQEEKEIDTMINILENFDIDKLKIKYQDFLDNNENN
jgi:hypothetical protein